VNVAFRPAVRAWPQHDPATIRQRSEYESAESGHPNRLQRGEDAEDCGVNNAELTIPGANKREEQV